MVKHEIRLDLAGADLDALVTEDDFGREAERLLPAALEELGQALGEAAWERRQADRQGPAVKYRGATGELREFVLKAGRTYRRFAPAHDRQTLKDLIVRKLRQAKARSGSPVADEMGSTIPAAVGSLPALAP
jgi:hypothetical protein